MFCAYLLEHFLDMQYFHTIPVIPSSNGLWQLFSFCPCPLFSLLQKNGMYFFDVEMESAKAKKDSWLEMSDDINQHIPIYSTGSVHI